MGLPNELLPGTVFPGNHVFDCNEFFFVYFYKTASALNQFDF